MDTVRRSPSRRVTSSTHKTYCPAICRSTICALDRTSFRIPAGPSKIRTVDNIASGWGARPAVFEALKEQKEIRNSSSLKASQTCYPRVDETQTRTNDPVARAYQCSTRPRPSRGGLALRLWPTWRSIVGVVPLPAQGGVRQSGAVTGWTECQLVRSRE